MRRLLRRKHSQEYFTGDGWSLNPELGKAFEDSVEVARACVNWNLTGVEIVLRLQNGAADVFCTEAC
jgi:hypothetical protein